MNSVEDQRTDSVEGLASRHSLLAVQYPETLELISVLARTDAGRQELRGLAPIADPGPRRNDFTSVQRLMSREGALVPSLETPLLPLVALLEHERSQIDPEDILLAARLIQITEKLLLRAEEAGVLTEGVEQLREAELLEEQDDEALPTLAALASRVAKILDARGRVRDDASKRLGSLRDQVRTHRDGLYETLSNYTTQHQDNLAEDTVTQRDGRMSVLLSSGSRGRMQGLIHGRSGTGKSYYFEPMEVVEANNGLQAATSEEQAERQRLLRELERGVRERAAAIVRRTRFLSYVDSLQATVHFADRARAVLPHLAGTKVDLRAARHPLLEPALESLRESSLGPSRSVDHLVPLDLDFGRDAVIVVTGPNAGGKTVALKTLGLLTAMAYAGLPIPADEASQLPAFDRMIAAVGDAQSLLEGKSTFSAQLLGVKAALEQATADSLILLDEVGSGTNPEEGAALTCALLEALVARGCTSLLTTHLIQVASLASELGGARGMAMEFDPERGLPTYELTSGASGGSHALELAERLELPESLLRRADELLGAEHRKLRSLIAETEALKQSLLEKEESLTAEVELRAVQTRDLEERLADLKQEKKKLRSRTEEQLDSFRREIRDHLEGEVERLKGELEAGRRKDVGRRAAKRLFETVKPKLPEVPDEDPVGTPEPGDEVRHKALGWRGRLDQLDGDRATVMAGGKRLQCRLQELVLAQKPGAKSNSRSKARPSRVSVTASAQTESSAEVNLIGQRVEPAMDKLEAYLDQALVGGLERVRVIHGHGSGRLRTAVRELLKRHPAVAQHEAAGAGEGGNGATIARIRGE